MRVLVYVALWCKQARPELRPSMELIVNMLIGLVLVDMPPETRMFMADFVMPIMDSHTASGLSRTHGATSAAQTNYPSTSTHSSLV